MGHADPAPPVGAGPAPGASPAGGRVGLAVPLVAWALSLLACLAGGAVARSLGEAPRLVLALLPWVALIGLPRGSRPPARRTWVISLALALPVLALAVSIDHRAGSPSRATQGAIASGLLYLVLLGEAAHWARGRARAVHAIAWLAVVPGSAALAAALSWGVTGAAGESGLPALLASIGPLGALWGDLGAAGSEVADALLRPSTIACAALLALTAVASWREEPAR